MRWSALRLACTPALTIVSGACTTAPANTDRQLIEAAFDRWSKGDAGFFNNVLAPDVVWTIKGSGPSAQTYRSREAFLADAVRPFAARLARPIRPVVRHIWADGPLIAVQWDGEGEALDGRPYRNSYVWVFEMREGRARRVDAYLDLPAYDDVMRRIPIPSVRE